MRYALLLATLISLSAIAEQTAKRPADLRATEAQPAVVRALPSPDAAAAEARRRKIDEHKMLTDNVVAASTLLLAFITALLAFYTYRLWVATKEGADSQAFATRESLKIARDAADAAKRNADAAILDKAPFLHPRVTEFALHPSRDDIGIHAHISSAIRLRFDNMGKTPAMLRRVGVRLLLRERGEVPEAPLPLEDIPRVESSDTIASGGAGGAREWRFERTIDEHEVDRLLADAQGNNFLRFYVEGFVVYDDIFNVRHTKRFLLKIRQNGFQAVRGGEAFNTLSREPMDTVAAEPNE